MKKLLMVAFAAMLVACAPEQKQKQFKLYGWGGAPKEKTVEGYAEQMQWFKDHNFDGLFYNMGFNVEQYKIAAEEAKKAGIEFHTWIPTMLQGGENIPEDWYGVSREGFSAAEKPAFVGYYKFLCPNREEVYDYLAEKYIEVAEIDGVDGIHLDYIRYPDAILARGLWDKYGLDMTTELAPYDYCYCDHCVAEFKEKTGIDIKAKGDDAQNVEEWKQFRYDVLTKFVNRLSKEIHDKTGKKLSAAVFPGPSDAKAMVRQDWGKWDLDMVAPMLYNDFYLEGPAWVGEKCKEGIAAVGDDVEFISGLFICGNKNGREGVKDPEGHGLMPDEIGEAITGSIEAGAKGICLFTPGKMQEGHWQVLDSLMYK